MARYKIAFSRIILALILTLVGFSQTYRYKVSNLNYDIFWFPLGVITKIVSGNEVLMLFAASIQFLIIFEFANRLARSFREALFVVAIAYLALVGVALFCVELYYLNKLNSAYLGSAHCNIRP